MKRLLFITFFLFPISSVAQTSTNFQANSATFTETMTAPSVNGILYVGPGGYSTIAAAVAAVGDRKATIVIESSYTGTECPATASSSLHFLDFRLMPNKACTQNVTQFNGSSGVVYSLQRSIQTVNGTPSVPATVSGYFQSRLINVAVGNTFVNADGGSHELEVTGTLSGTLLVAQGSEDAVVIASTGGAIATATGVIGYVTGRSGTTNVTNAIGVRGLGCGGTFGRGTVENCYGAYFDAQSAGSSRNFGFYAQGPGLFASDKTSSGINFEDSSFIPHPVMTALASDNEIRFRPMIDAAGFRFADVGSTADWLIIRSTGVSIPSLGFSVGPGNPVTSTGAGGTMASTIASGTATMTTAAIRPGACGDSLSVSATNVLTTDAISWSFSAAPAANPAKLVVSAWPTSNKVNFQYCNPTAHVVTPHAAKLNWRVVR